MFTGDLTSEQGKQDYENYIMNNVRNEINSYTKQSQNNNISSSVSGVSGSLTPSVILPSGVIVPFAGGPGVTPNPGTRQDVPDGWLLCAGAAMSRIAYSGLFTIIGTTYGVGDGSTTFNLPDLRGRIPVGAGTGAQNGTASSGVITGGTALTARSVGQFFGDERLQSHTHTGSGSTSESATTSFLRLVAGIGTTMESNHHVGRGGGGFADYAGAFPQHFHPFSFTTNDHNQTPVGLQQNLQPSVVTNYIIKI